MDSLFVKNSSARLRTSGLNQKIKIILNQGAFKRLPDIWIQSADIKSGFSAPGLCTWTIPGVPSSGLQWKA